MRIIKKVFLKAWLAAATLFVAVFAMLHFDTKDVKAANYTDFDSFKSAVEAVKEGYSATFYVTKNFTFTDYVDIQRGATIYVYVQSDVTMATGGYYFKLDTNSKLYLGNSTYTGTISSTRVGDYGSKTNIIAKSKSAATSGTLISIAGGSYTGYNQDDMTYLFNVANGTFNMSGGTIRNAHAGVQVVCGTFKMSGGTITNMSGSYCVGLGIMAEQEAQGTYIPGEVTATISGGTLSNFKYAGIGLAKSYKTSLTISKVTICDGQKVSTSSLGIHVLPDASCYDSSVNNKNTTTTITLNPTSSGDIKIYNCAYGIYNAASSGSAHGNKNSVVLKGAAGGTRIYNCTYGLYNADEMTVSAGYYYNNIAYNVYNCGNLVLSGGTLYSDDTTYPHYSGSSTNTGTKANNPSGVCNASSGTVTISGAIIRDHASYGVRNMSGTVTMNSGYIYGNSSGYGVLNSSTFKLAGGNIYDCSTGIYNSSNVTISGGNVYDNTTGVTNKSTLTMTGGSVKTNGVGINNTKTATVSGGGVVNNTGYGIYNDGTDAVFKASGTAAIYGNSGEKGCAYHNGASFTVTGTYSSGTVASVSGYIYLAADDKYVTTNSLTNTIKVYPNSYTNGRVVISTSSSSYAATQKGSGLYPKTGWYLTTSGSKVVLSDKYNVVFRNWTGAVISSKTYSYGATVVEAAHPADYRDDMYTYSFSRWSPTFSSVCKGAADYSPVADNTARQYTVTFLDHDDTVISSREYIWGANIIIPDNPNSYTVGSTKYIFDSWSPSVISSCAGDATYRATYLSERAGSSPVIQYDGTEIAGTLILPGMTKWFNIKTIKTINDFTAVDNDNDVASLTIRDKDNSKELFVGMGTGALYTISPNFEDEGVNSYPIIAADELGNRTERNVVIRADFTPPSLIGEDGTEGQRGNQGVSSDGLVYWSTVIATGDDVIQTADDALSGITKIVMYKYTDQDTPIANVTSTPFKISAKLSDNPSELGYVVKTWDAAGNAAYKLVVNGNNLKAKIEVTLPRENF